MLHSNSLAFLAVVDFGSFTLAADKLSTSKARVSQQVSALEKYLGVTLLHRSTRRIRLTEIGEAYYGECKRAASIIENAENSIHEDQSKLGGMIRMNSVGGLFAEQLLSPAIAEFISQYPEISVNIDFSSQRIDVIAEHYDLVLRMGELEDSSLVARTLMKLGSNVVASPQFLQTNGCPASPNELPNYRCLCGSVRRWQLTHRQTGSVQDTLVNGALISPNGHLLLDAALQGAGIVRLNDLYLSPYVKNKQLIPVFKDWYIPAQPVSLVYPRVRYKTRRIQVFIDYLLDWFRAYDHDSIKKARIE